MERQPGEATRSYTGAIDDRGDWLVATTPAGGGAIWLHPSAAGCPYAPERIRLGGARTGNSGWIALSAGRAGTFHLAFMAPGEALELSTVRVRCAARRGA